MRVTGTSDPNCDGDYYPNVQQGSDPLVEGYTLDNAPWDLYSQQPSRFEFSGIAWGLVHMDEFGDHAGGWTSNDSPYPPTPDQATTWTPNDSEGGYPIVVDVSVEIEIPFPAPVTVLPTLPVPVAPTPILP